MMVFNIAAYRNIIFMRPETDKTQKLLNVSDIWGLRVMRFWASFRAVQYLGNLNRCVSLGESENGFVIPDHMDSSTPKNAKSEKGLFCHDKTGWRHAMYCPGIQLEWDTNNL